MSAQHATSHKQHEVALAGLRPLPVSIDFALASCAHANATSLPSTASSDSLTSLNGGSDRALSATSGDTTRAQFGSVRGNETAEGVLRFDTENGADSVYLINAGPGSRSGPLSDEEQSEPTDKLMTELKIQLATKKLAVGNAYHRQDDYTDKDLSLRGVMRCVKKTLLTGSSTISLQLERNDGYKSNILCQQPFCAQKKNIVAPGTFFVYFSEPVHFGEVTAFCLICIEQLWEGCGMQEPLELPQVVSPTPSPKVGSSEKPEAPWYNLDGSRARQGLQGLTTAPSLIGSLPSLHNVDSPIRKSLAEPNWCYCHRCAEGTMVQCANPKCPVGWYHEACISRKDAFAVGTQANGEDDKASGPRFISAWYCGSCSPNAVATGAARTESLMRQILPYTTYATGLSPHGLGIHIEPTLGGKRFHRFDSRLAHPLMSPTASGVTSLPSLSFSSTMTDSPSLTTRTCDPSDFSSPGSLSNAHALAPIPCRFQHLAKYIRPSNSLTENERAAVLIWKAATRQHFLAGANFEFPLKREQDSDREAKENPMGNKGTADSVDKDEILEEHEVADTTPKWILQSCYGETLSQVLYMLAS